MNTKEITEFNKNNLGAVRVDIDKALKNGQRKTRNSI